MSDTDINATVNVTEDVFADVDSTAMSAAVIDDGDSIVVPAEVDFGHTLDTELEDNDLIDVPVDESVGIAGDHRVLLHRDSPNQHPMGAITGLNDALAGINTALSSRISQVEAETADLDVDMADALLRIGDLQNQVDGNITTWFYAAEPAMNLPPVAYDPSNPHDTGWDTDDKKNAHKGDLYYNTLTGYAYRFAYADGDYGWMRITDTDVVKALADAAKAQDTADSKRRVFYTTPTPPYDKGDLWVQGGSGDILVCTTEKPADGSYSISDWGLASKYTDDYVANQALASANGKNTVYHQPSQPTGGTYKQGDTWFDTDDDYTMYTYDGSLWIKEQFGNEAIADLSISNAKIKDATIEYGKIKSVDAGKITVGYLNAARIEAGSLGVGKIDATSGTFNTANIPNLNANKITAGDISADRMKVNSISAINSNTGSVQISASKVDIAGAAVFNNYSTTQEMNTAIGDAVDGIEVGGRNLHKDSANLGASWNKDNATVSGGVGTISLAGSGNHRIFQMPANGYWGIWKANTTYTVSVDAKTDTNGLKLSLEPYAGGVTSKAYSLTTEWKRYSYTFTSNSTTSTASCSYFAINGTSGNVFIRNPKLEYGNKATDWSPAPEDAQDAEQRVYYRSNSTTAPTAPSAWVTSTATANTTWTTKRMQYDSTYKYLYTCIQRKTVGGTITNSTVLLDDTTTVIDGGNIITGTVTANQLNADNINASNTLTVGAMTTDAQNSILNSNMKVGGRNLFLGTARSDTWTSNHASGSFTVRDTYQTYLPVNALFKVNDLITISFDWSTSATGGNFRAECGNVSPWGWGTIVNAYGTRASNSNFVDVTSSNRTGHVEITFQITSSQTAAADTFRWLRIRSDGDEMIGKTITLSNAKCEFGNKATAWTPALEDDASGKNLMRYTHKLSTCSFATVNGTISTGTDTRVPSGQFLRATMSSAATGGVHISTSNLGWDYNGQMVNGQTYTFSAWVRSSMAFTFSSLGLERFSQKSIKITKVPANEWTFVWCVGTYDSSIQYQSCVFYTGSTWSVGSTLDISSMKLELGSQPTLWTPAVGDMAISYLHADSNGLRIASANPSTQNQRVQMTSSDIDMYDSGGVKRINLNSTNGVTVGRSDKGHTTVNDNGLYIYDTNNKKRSQVDASGLNVFDTDGSTSVALFGSTARIGKSNNGRVEVSNTAIDLYSGTTKACTVSEYTSGTGKITVYGANSKGTIVYPTGFQCFGTAASDYSYYASTFLRLGSSNDLDGIKLSKGSNRSLLIDAPNGVLINDHSSAVGSIVSAYLTANKAISAGTAASLCNIQLTAGVWVIVAVAQFPNGSDATYRRLKISTSSTSAEPPDVQISAHNGHPTTIQSTKIVSISSTTNYYLTVMSAKALTLLAGSVDGFNYIKAVRIV